MVPGPKKVILTEAQSLGRSSWSVSAVLKPWRKSDEGEIALGVGVTTKSECRCGIKKKYGKGEELWTRVEGGQQQVSTEESRWIKEVVGVLRLRIWRRSGNDEACLH